MAETLLRTQRREPSGKQVSGLDDKSVSGMECVLEHIDDAGPVVGIAQVVQPHLQQLRRGRPDDLAKSIVDELEAPGARSIWAMPTHGLAEHGAENLLLLAQLGFAGVFAPPRPRSGRGSQPKR